MESVKQYPLPCIIAVCILLILIFLYLIKRFVLCGRKSYNVPTCDHKIYCQGKLLDTVQRARLYPDSKTFVDMKMKKPTKEILKEFNALMKSANQTPTKEQIQAFVDANFDEGNELEVWIPTDYSCFPKFLYDVEDLVLRDFAKKLVHIWPLLARKVRQEVAENKDRYSLLPIPNGFIVPGGRFREYYYWDSYWIIQGLLLSEMDETAKGMIENFFFVIEKHGFVPNGGRVYYLNRSQPPLLTLMGASYYEKTKDTEWLKSNVKYFDKELNHWLKKRTVGFKKDGVKYTAAHYSTNSGTPRPESYYEDVTTASRISGENEKRKCYAELKSAAEAGWDFSSRWMFNEGCDCGNSEKSLENIDVSRIVPVDLNAILCKSFQTLSEFYKDLGSAKKSDFWAKKADAWQKLIDQILWNEEDGIWYDFDIKLQIPRKLFFPSNVTPLWTRSFSPQDGPRLGKRVLNYLSTKKILDFPGGIPASLEKTGQQWDLPNAWPPMQAIVVQGLDRSGDPAAREQASQLAHKWVRANLKGFTDTKEMFEKYDAEVPGMYGGGGEYTVQSGFGWTNGVVLEFIHDYCSKRKEGDGNNNVGGKGSDRRGSGKKGECAC